MYLPDGQLIFAPEDPYTWSEGEYVHPAKLTHDVGQAGLFYAQRPFFQGLATSATTWSVNQASIGLQTEIIDSAQGHSTSTNNTRYTFPATRNGGYPADDYYLCIGYLPLASTNAAGNYSAELLMNGGGAGSRSGMAAPSGAGHNVDTMVVDIVTATGTGSSGGPYVELAGYKFDATSLSTVTSSKCPSLTVRWIGCNRTWNTTTPVAAPHSWVAQDEASADATGASSQPGGMKVPLNAEIRPNLRFYNSPPICRISSIGTTQTVATGTTWTSIQFPNMQIDNFGGWSSANNTRYTCQRAGLYLISGNAAWSESSGTHSGYRACRLRVNGNNSLVYGGNTILPTTGTATDPLAVNATALIQLNVGDYVELQLQQTQTNAPTSLSIYGVTGSEASMIAVWQSL